jgi:hypothetical protein
MTVDPAAPLAGGVLTAQFRLADGVVAADVRDELSAEVEVCGPSTFWLSATRCCSPRRAQRGHLHRYRLSRLVRCGSAAEVGSYSGRSDARAPTAATLLRTATVADHSLHPPTERCAPNTDNGRLCNETLHNLLEDRACSCQLPQPLMAGQKIRPRQTFGGVTSSWSIVVIVRDHTADFPAGPPRPQIKPGVSAVSGFLCFQGSGGRVRS